MPNLDNITNKPIDASNASSSNILMTLNASSESSNNTLVEKGQPLSITRDKLATMLIWGFGITVASILYFFLFFAVCVIFLRASNPEEVTEEDISVNTSIAPLEVINPFKDIFTLLITTQSTLIGSAIGFYFGEKSSNKE